MEIKCANGRSLLAGETAVLEARPAGGKQHHGRFLTRPMEGHQWHGKCSSQKNPPTQANQKGQTFPFD